MADRIIYHICRHDEWRAAGAGGTHPGSSQDIADGFIHFSTAAQIRVSAAKYRAGQDGLVLVAADAHRLGTALRWEPSRGGRLFPHLHGDLPAAAVIGACALILGPDGRHRFPALATQDLAALDWSGDPISAIQPSS